MRRGFTLVELSIVLVIIGLLIGGILVAQSMIKTTKMQIMVNENSQLFTIFSLFHERYRYLPGDAPEALFAGSTCGGCGYVLGNGIIDDYTNTGYVFYQLINAGMFDPSQWGIQNFNKNSYEIGIGRPRSRYDKQVSWMFQSNGMTPPTTMMRYVYSFPNNNGSYTFINGIDAGIFDRKIDDGYRTTGVVQGESLAASRADLSGGSCNWGPNSFGYATNPTYGCANVFYFQSVDDIRNLRF